MRSPHKLARARRVLVMGAALAVGVGRAAPARGDGAEGWLEWTRAAGAESCAGGAEFSAAVAAQLGEPPAAAARRWHRRVTVLLERRSAPPASWSADLRLTTDDGRIAGSRRIERDARSCAPLVDALTLVAALLLSEAPPSLAAVDPPAARPVPAPPPRPAAPPTAVAVAPAPAAARARSWGGSVEAGIAAGVGLLPNLAAAGEIRVAVAPPAGPTWFASAVAWRAQTAEVEGGARGATLGLWLAGLGVCPVDVRWSSRAVSGCAGGEVGRLRASGFGFDVTYEQRSWAADLTAGGRLRQEIAGGFFVGLDLRAMVPLLRDRVTFATGAGTETEVFRASPVGAVAGIEVGYAHR
jgi:hypothetical protein